MLESCQVDVRLVRPLSNKSCLKSSFDFDPDPDDVFAYFRCPSEFIGPFPGHPRRCFDNIPFEKRAISHDGVRVGAGTTDFGASQNSSENQLSATLCLIVAFAERHPQMAEVLRETWCQDGAHFSSGSKTRLFSSDFGHRRPI
jgi:hypothetical protein